jgi:murein DD-endopeptidase MepM/ murein hydrolase activator NlpD
VFSKLNRDSFRSLSDRTRIDVIRHRVSSRFSRHGQTVLAVLAALALIGAGTLVADAAIPGSGPATATARATGGGSALADRAAGTDRTDRSDRGQPGKSQAAAPEKSPRPKQKRKQPAPAKPKKKKQQKQQARPRPAWVSPMPGAGTTSCFGWRWGVLHAGVDLAARAGTPIKAVGAGTVSAAGWVFSGYGISVVINHGNGFFTHYAHASQAKVSPGQRVSPGQTIALEGSTGDSSGPHLHFEVHRGMWNQIEPTTWLRYRGVHVGGC